MFKSMSHINFLKLSITKIDWLLQNSKVFEGVKEKKKKKLTVGTFTYPSK